MKIKVGLLIVSDRSFRGERADSTTPLFKEKIIELEWELTKTGIVPDEIEEVSKQLSDWSDNRGLDIIFTSGGTGFSPRDITPEATLSILDKQAPGIVEALRMDGLKSTPYSMLSRSVAGIRKSCLIINLPGSPKAAVEGLVFLANILPHAVLLIHNTETDHA